MCHVVVFKMKKIENIYIYLGIFDGYWRYFFNSSYLLKGLHKYYLKIRELFWYVKMEIRFFGKLPQNHIYKTANKFTQQLRNIFKVYVAHSIIQRLNFGHGMLQC